MKRFIKKNEWNVPMPAPMQVGLASLLIFIVLALSYSDSETFNEAVMAEVAGNFFAIALAIIILDTYRKARWSKVRTEIYKIILIDLCAVIEKFIHHFHIYFNKHPDILVAVINGKNRPNMDSVTNINKLANLINSSDLRKWREKGVSGNPRKSATDYYESISWRLDEIRIILVPILYESNEDEEVIHSLLEFDFARKEFNESIKSQGSSNKLITDNLVALIQKISILYKLLYDRYQRTPIISEFIIQIIIVRLIYSLFSISLVYLFIKFLSLM